MGFFLPCVNVSAATATLTVSDEVSGNNAASRTLAGALDDSWGAAYPSGSHRPDLFSGGSGYSGTGSFNDPLGNSYQVDWQFGSIDDMGPGLPTSTSFANATTGSIIYGTSNSIQSGSPNPYNTETRISSSVSGAGLGAVKLDFTNSTTDILEFGIYIGDLEARSNNGTDGRVLIYDALGVLIGDEPFIFTGSIQSSAGTSTYTVVEPLGSPSGPNNNSLRQWGNRTSAFLAIAADVPIGSVVIHVGDDDHTNNNTGATEGLGIAGFQIPAAPIGGGTAQLSADKSVAMYSDSPSAYSVPGAEFIYEITVKNIGDGDVDIDSIFFVDSLPPEVTFYYDDIDGLAGPETQPVSFSQIGAGLFFDATTDVKYSLGPTKPTSFGDCSYAPPLAGYDSAIRFVCFNPKGTMAFDPSEPEFSVAFRVKLK